MLLHDLLSHAATRFPEAAALVTDARTLTYDGLQAEARRYAGGLLELGLCRADRVAVFLEKRVEAVAALFGSSAAGCAAVPINPVLKGEQVRHILRDCEARVLVTSAARLRGLGDALTGCPALRAVVLVDASTAGSSDAGNAVPVVDAGSFRPAPHGAGFRTIDADMAAIFYTSGSTGRPKGVVVSHRNLAAGAASVTAYLGNHPGDVILAALPLSFDAGFSQMTTAFLVGARLVLLNYLLPQDVLRAIDAHGVTGITAVPPLYIQLARLDRAVGSGDSLRYFANTGGHMPREVLAMLRRRWPRAAPFLMYGLTEAFRSTYLPPEEVDRRPDSIGRAIPGAEILVLRPDGSPCAPGEAGELVHRGALVSLGYWNDPDATAERFRPLPPGAAGRPGTLPLPEIAVYSGDTVRADEEGFLYFVGRTDGLIKTSGYRVSPTEVEEAVYASGLVSECLAVGLPDAALGQAIVVAVYCAGGATCDSSALIAHCRARLPAYMVPSRIASLPEPLPRNPNGKIDRVAVIARLDATPTAP